MDLQNCVTYYKLRDFLGMEVHAPLKEIWQKYGFGRQKQACH